jgi:hypothetical protein
MRATTVIVLAVLVTGCASTDRDGSGRTELLGNPGPGGAADRTILIRPQDRYVNVEAGEAIQFKVGDQAFTWAFTFPDYRAFDLNLVAPPGMLDRPVTVYVAPNPLYSHH